MSNAVFAPQRVSGNAVFDPQWKATPVTVDTALGDLLLEGLPVVISATTGFVVDPRFIVVARGRNFVARRVG